MMNSLNDMRSRVQEIGNEIDRLYQEKQEMKRKYREMRGLSRWGYDYVIYKRALEEAREPIENPRVVYQGEPGAFSEMAAINFFGEKVNTKGLYGFEDNFIALRSGAADYAVLPIENSSTGAIRQVYDLMMQYECYLVGETTVQVCQSLMALPGTKLEDITTVYSHEQGLFQCEQFLNQYPAWKKVPQSDTAGSAKMVAELQDPHIAAICSSRAAEIYGLNILVKAANFNANNTTRFVVVAPRMEFRENRNKVCISMTAPHQAGSLFEILSIFKTNNINMVKLESRPIIGHNWEYMFFIEFQGDLLDQGMDQVMKDLTEEAGDIRVYGNYASALI